MRRVWFEFATLGILPARFGRLRLENDLDTFYATIVGFFTYVSGISINGSMTSRSTLDPLIILFLNPATCSPLACDLGV